MEEPLLLLVEDETLVMLVAHEALEGGGYRVIPVTGGEAALRAIDARNGELAGLVTDVRLGAGPSGWEVARRARELNAELPVVYTTADGAAEWPALGVPNSLLVQKPFAPAQLVTAISSLIVAADTKRTS